MNVGVFGDVPKSGEHYWLVDLRWPENSPVVGQYHLETDGRGNLQAWWDLVGSDEMHSVADFAWFAHIPVPEVPRRG